MVGEAKDVDVAHHRVGQQQNKNMVSNSKVVEVVVEVVAEVVVGVEVLLNTSNSSSRCSKRSKRTKSLINNVAVMDVDVVDAVAANAEAAARLSRPFSSHLAVHLTRHIKSHRHKRISNLPLLLLLFLLHRCKSRKQVLVLFLVTLGAVPWVKDSLGSKYYISFIDSILVF